MPKNRPYLSLFVAFVGEVLAQGFTPRGPQGRWGHARALSGRSHLAPVQLFGGWAAALPVGGEFRASVSGKSWAIMQWASPLFILQGPPLTVQLARPPDRHLEVEVPRVLGIWGG